MQRFNVYHSRRSVWENHVVTSCGKENFFHSAVQSVLRLSLQVSLFIKQMKSISVMKKKKKMKKSLLRLQAIREDFPGWQHSLSVPEKSLPGITKFTRCSQQRRRNRNYDQGSLSRVEGHPSHMSCYYSLSLLFFFFFTHTHSSHYT